MLLIRVQCSSVGCGIAHLNTAQLIGVQCSSEDAVHLRGCRVAQKRMQQRSVGCRVVQ